MFSTQNNNSRNVVNLAREGSEEDKRTVSVSNDEKKSQNRRSAMSSEGIYERLRRALGRAERPLPSHGCSQVNGGAGDR